MTTRTFPCPPCLIIGGLLLVAPAHGAQAADVALGSVRLRGGFDANPALLPGGKGSAFTGIDGAFAAGREHGATIAGMVGEVQRTDYATASIAPSERYRLEVKVQNSAAGDWTLRSSSSVESNRSATLQLTEASQRVRAQWSGGALRPFLVGEIGATSLNETNVILTSFLPEPHRFVRATATPGMTVQLGNAEIGASAAVSSTRYADKLDLFGYRRDNERAEAFLFGRYEGQGLSAAVSVSRLYGRWRDESFSAVAETLYDASLTKKMGAWTLDLAAKRQASDTTFPISPIAITSDRTAKVSVAADSRLTLGLIGRALRTDYLDSPFSTDTLAYGVIASYAVTDDWLLDAQVMRVKATALDGEPANGGVVSLSLTRKFASQTPSQAPSPPGAVFDMKRWAADRPPPIAPPSAVKAPTPLTTF